MISSLETEPKHRLHPAVVDFLEELELAAKQEIGLVPEQLVYEAREQILRRPDPPTSLLLDCDSTTTRELDNVKTNDVKLQLSEWLNAKLGSPSKIVSENQKRVSGDTKDLGGNAPGWRICCVHCGRSAPAAKRGWIRIGAYSVHKYVGGWCENCRAPRSIRVIQDLEQTNLTRLLGASKSPEELREEMHDPTIVLRILGTIFGSAALIALALYAMISWLLR